MTRFLSIVLFTMVSASPTLAQIAPPTSSGGGPNLGAQSTKGTGTIGDTTAHTETNNGVVVSTSMGKDGKPNGGVGGSSTESGGPRGASYEDQ
jgi:hypothetical protein